MEPQAFALLMARFDTLEEQGRATHALLTKHAEEDAVVHKTVERHSLYWSVLLLGIPTLGSYLAKKMGLSS